MIRGGIHDRCAERAHKGAALFRDVGWHHQGDRDAARGGVHRKCRTRVPTRWLEQLFPRGKKPLEDEVVDQRLRGAVLDRPGWPEHLNLRVQMDPFRAHRFGE